ncbi:MAG TPA: DegT/DnrJ/EryC1/StrS family aminotransferase [Polyangiaceae bacterium]|jgi:dTDP-4-amino-4,6-dideoxygalactose transaminase
MDKPAVLGGAAAIAKDAHRLWPLIGDEEKRAVMRVLDRGIIQGWQAPETRAFEEEFAAFVACKRALMTHCGTSALQLAVAAAGVGEADEVIVPAYSFVATPMCIALQGATPVFVDVDAETGHIDPALARAAITSRTKAIMPVHIHGEAADMTALLALCKEKKLALIEDAAQAHGADWDGKRVGAIGISGGFSLQGSKNLTAGEGGFFVTNDEGAAELANRVRNFSLDVSLDDAWDPKRPLDGSRAVESQAMGSMYRGNEMAAAFGRAQLARLPGLTAAAQKNGWRLAKKLAELPGVLPPRELPGRTTVFHKFRVRFDVKKAGLDVAPRVLRDAMKAALAAEGLEVVSWQGKALPAHPVFQKRAEYMFRGLPGGTDLAKNYEPSQYARTSALLESSLVLFSQSHPLIGQDEAVVDRYAEAFARVWHHREAIVRAFK